MRAGICRRLLAFPVESKSRIASTYLAVRQGRCDKRWGVHDQRLAALWLRARHGACSVYRSPESKRRHDREATNPFSGMPKRRPKLANDLNTEALPWFYR
jgi:hypothetical protein